MANIHLFQWAVSFITAMSLTGAWLLIRPSQRWRHIIPAFISTILWIVTAYTADNVAVADQGAVVTFGSDALAAFGVVMVVINILGAVLGLVLWTENEAARASEDLPGDMRRPGD